MRKMLLSFKPEVYEKIKSGKKKFEHRRNFPDEPIISNRGIVCPNWQMQIFCKNSIEGIR